MSKKGIILIVRITTSSDMILTTQEQNIPTHMALQAEIPSL
jgi:hypothetical protein